MLITAGGFRIRRLAFGRIDGSKRRMRAARAGFYEVLWRTAAEAAGTSITLAENGSVEMQRGGLCLRARENETQVDEPAALARAGNKLVTHRLLSDGGIPVPRHIMVTLGEYDHALAYLQSIGGPVVVKPAAGTGGGAGVTTNVFTADQLRSAMSWSRTYGKDILVEEQIDGDCYRILLMDGKHVDSILRRPPTVIGDGRSTIRQLLQAENRRRVEQGAARAQVLIAADRDLTNTLFRQGLSLGSRPQAGAVVRLKQVINENALQENLPASSLLCADIIACARKAAELVGVRLAGVDVICRDPKLPLEVGEGAIIEVNGQPGLYFHHVDGRAPLVAKGILELYFGGRREPAQRAAALAATVKRSGHGLPRERHARDGGASADERFTEMN